MVCLGHSSASWSDTDLQWRFWKRRELAAWAEVLHAGRARWWRRTTCQMWPSTFHPLDSSLKKPPQNDNIFKKCAAICTKVRTVAEPDPWTNVKTLGWEVEQDRMCIEPPWCKDVWGLTYTPCHIKHRKPLKPNKHFDTCRAVKRESLIKQIMYQPECLEIPLSRNAL